ncbi:glycosyltransferase family 2 protein [uncultured Tateyamaria sp.]|uniref:glycosyltransferase family 2 protein n=1 Tax=uncultured Tateyamaria sp. TaxID=455651 RepID=UPI00260B60DA|nr:glycosyltransferase family 2 protein [uncultured Tateyamaria sp.]
MSDPVLHRRLSAQPVPGGTLLDAVIAQATDARHLTLFFDANVQASAVTPPPGATLVTAKSIGEAPILTFALPDDAALAITIDGQPIDITPSLPEHDLFEGLNCLASVRNGESADTVLDWLAYHVAHHELEGVVLLDQAKPGSDKRFAKDLAAGIAAQAISCTVLILSSDVPLGQAGQPPEGHPFSAPGAPGKDRMKLPDPDPWSAPLGAFGVFEIIRERFLQRARAVANVEVYDLITRGDLTVFDTAVRAQGGVIQLQGEQCYPWRVRNGDPIRFGDHICVQFDRTKMRKRFCIAPDRAPDTAVWRPVRIGNGEPDEDANGHFYRHMSLRHPTRAVAKIVPKSSLVESEELLKRAADLFDHDPVRMPEDKLDNVPKGRGRCAIVTTMKNEGPFILEWLAYHRSIGFDDIIVYTNDCTDGTDTMLEMLQAKGIVQHRINKFEDMGLKPQHAALQSAESEKVIKQAKWVTCIDVDEYVNIKVGDGTLDALFAAVPDANMISMTWRLFGNGNVHEYVDQPITEQFQMCAPELARKPHQAWGFKTLFLTNGIFKKLGVHRPKGLKPQFWDRINWVNGSGKPMPPDVYRNAWRSTTDTYGYDLVQLNHYAVRSAESFLVKRDRGRVNHVDRDQGLAYWFRMNNNAEAETSILSRLPRMKEELARLMADPDIAAAHAHSVACHRAKIDALKATENYANFYAELTSPRMEKLSTLHTHFGANVFLSGPAVVPDDIVEKPQDEDWFFTVELQGSTQH